MNDVLDLLRPDLRGFGGYASARREKVVGSVWLNANESSLPSAADPGLALNRYPQPQPEALRARLAWLYGVRTEQVLVTRGSDEGIDLLVRAFCRAGLDGVLVAPPCFGMYAVAARIQGAPLVEAPLRELDGEWQIDLPSLLESVSRRNVRIVFLCSPANPTGQALTHRQIRSLAQALEGRAILVVDEAYIEFSATVSATSLLAEFSGLVLLRTLSKAHALAGARIGAVLAAPELVSMLGNIGPPYPIAAPSAALALAALSDAALERSRQGVVATIRERRSLSASMANVAGVRFVYPSEGNFLLVRFDNRAAVYERLLAAGVVVRDVSAMPGLQDALRISVGAAAENAAMLAALTGIRVPSPAQALADASRVASVERNTRETRVRVTIDLDQAAEPVAATGLGFFDHMLEQLGKHAGIGLILTCAGDLHVDEHHTVEDCALSLGEALRRALGDKFGIGRYGFTVPMDESLATAALDLSGRPYFVFEGRFPREQVGDLPTELVPHFFRSLCQSAGMTLHLSVTGENAHHMVEACFKAVARALRQALRRDGADLPSTKGML